MRTKFPLEEVGDQTITTVVVVVVVMKDMPTLLQTSLLESCSQSKTSEYTSQAYKVPVSIAGR